MKLIKPSFEILEQYDINKHIELCGRTCYKSEDKITNDSSIEFVQRLIKSGHTSVLEHGTIYLAIPSDEEHFEELIYSYNRNKYSEVRYSNDLKDGTAYITTNYRVIIENNWLNDLQFITEPTESYAKRISVKFICNRQVSHEFVRHRVFSFSQESTRYCNYSKDKFDNELTFIEPCWFNDDLNEFAVVELLKQINFVYNQIIAGGYKPQQAATILPNALKTELVMTGFIENWKHFFELRCSPAAHPQARELAIPLKEEFIRRGYING